MCAFQKYTTYDSLLKATLVSNHTYIQYASHPAKTLARLWSVDMHNTRFISPFFSHFENRTSIAPTFQQHVRLWHIQWSSPCTARALPRLLSVRKRGENHFRGGWGQLLARDTSKIPLQTHKCANAKVKRMCGSILYYWVLVQHTLMPSQNHVVIAKLHFFSNNDIIIRLCKRTQHVFVKHIWPTQIKHWSAQLQTLSRALETLRPGWPHQTHRLRINVRSNRNANPTLNRNEKCIKRNNKSFLYSQSASKHGDWRASFQTLSLC